MRARVLPFDGCFLLIVTPGFAWKKKIVRPFIINRYYNDMYNNNTMYLYNTAPYDVNINADNN